MANNTTRSYFQGMVLPLDEAYLTAIGGVLAQWGFFETDFDLALYYMRHDPAVAALSPDVPRALRHRIALFQRSARACFSGCPTLAEKLVSIAGEAKATGRLRNLIAHGRWGVGRDSVRVHSTNDGKFEDKCFSLEDLASLRDRISENHWRLAIITHPSPYRDGLKLILASDEIAAVQEGHKRLCLPLPPPDPYFGMKS